MNKRGFVTPLALVFFLVFFVLLGGIYYLKNKAIQSINSFEDCARAGYPVLLSYPGQCNTPDGRHFVQQLTDEEKKKIVPPSTTNPSGSTKDDFLQVDFNLPSGEVYIQSKHQLVPSSILLSVIKYLGGSRREQVLKQMSLGPSDVLIEEYQTKDNKTALFLKGKTNSAAAEGLNHLGVKVDGNYLIEVNGDLNSDPLVIKKILDSIKLVGVPLSFSQNTIKCVDTGQTDWFSYGRNQKGDYFVAINYVKRMDRTYLTQPGNILAEAGIWVTKAISNPDSTSPDKEVIMKPVSFTTTFSDASTSGSVQKVTFVVAQDEIRRTFGEDIISRGIGITFWVKANALKTETGQYCTDEGLGAETGQIDSITQPQ